MNCPDWPRAVAARERDPAAWDLAVDHLDACDRCREAALAAEPTLLFRRLPSPAVGADEVAAMKNAVAAMRRAAPLTRPERRRWPRWVAAAAVLLAAVFVESDEAPPSGDEAAALALAPAPATSSFAGMALVEDADPAFGQIVELVADEVMVVVVIPPRIDV